MKHANFTLTSLILRRQALHSPFLAFNKQFMPDQIQILKTKFQYSTNTFLYQVGFHPLSLDLCSFRNFSNTVVKLNSISGEYWDRNFDEVAKPDITGDIQFVRCTFTSCISPETGGAISIGITYGYSLKLYTCNFSYCTAGTDGGAVYCGSNYHSVIDSVIFSHNRAGNNGGAFYFISTSTFKLYRSELYNNTCGLHGGGFYLEWSDSEPSISYIYFNNENNASNYRCFYINGLSKIQALDIIIENNYYAEMENFNTNAVSISANFVNEDTYLRQHPSPTFTLYPTLDSRHLLSIYPHFNIR